MNNSPIKVGLAGFGIAAQVMHAPFITTMKEYQLVSVLERHNNFAQEKYPFIKTVRSFEELISDPEIDLIIITTPNDTHFEYAQKALLAGKHVVLEKPFTNTSEEAKILIEVSKKTKRILSVFQNRRYVCDFLTIKKILKEKLLGEIVEYEAHYDRYRTVAKPGAWREENKPGSGIFYDLGAHLIDQALVLFGFPKTVTADLRMQRPHSIEAHVNDYFDVRLDYGFKKNNFIIRHVGSRSWAKIYDSRFQRIIYKIWRRAAGSIIKRRCVTNNSALGRRIERSMGIITYGD